MEREDEITIEVRLLRERAQQLEAALEQARIKIAELEQRLEQFSKDESGK